MKHLKHLSILAGLTAGTLTGFTAAASADELVLSSWLPPKHPVVTGVIEPWAQQVADATEGRVTVRVLPKPLGPPPAHYDLAADGVADITYVRTLEGWVCTAFIMDVFSRRIVGWRAT